MKVVERAEPVENAGGSWLHFSDFFIKDANAEVSDDGTV